MNAVAYARISTIDQSQNSIPGQIERIESFCKRNNITLSKIFVDNGQSAFNFNRKEWKELEAYIKTNKEIKYLVVDTMDRFSRANLVDALQKMNDIQQRLKVKILTVSDPLNLDTEDFGVELRRIMELMFSNYELKKIRKRTSDGMITALKSGRWISRAPFGYLNKRDVNGKPVMEPDPDKSYVVRMIFRLYLSGMQIEEIRKHVSANGMTLKGNSSIRRILSNPLYASMISVNKLFVKAIHPPIISESEYWAAQEKLNHKTRATQRRDDVFLVGVLKCHCGRLLTTDKSRSMTGKEYKYYVCPVHRKAFNVDKLHDKFYQILELISLPAENIKSIAGKLRVMMDERVNNQTSDLMRAKLNLRKVQDKIASTQEKFLKQPDISESVYKKVISELKADESRLLTQIAGLNKKHPYEFIEQLLPKLSQFHILFKEWPLYRRQAFIRMVFDNTLWYEGKIYRTRFIHPLFGSNLLALKEKGLLIIEQPEENSGSTPVSSPCRPFIELLESVLCFFDHITEPGKMVS